MVHREAWYRESGSLEIEKALKDLQGNPTVYTYKRALVLMGRHRVPEKYLHQVQKRYFPLVYPHLRETLQGYVRDLTSGTYSKMMAYYKVNDLIRSDLVRCMKWVETLASAYEFQGYVDLRDLHILEEEMKEWREMLSEELPPSTLNPDYADYPFFDRDDLKTHEIEDLPLYLYRLVPRPGSPS